MAEKEKTTGTSNGLLFFARFLPLSPFICDCSSHCPLLHFSHNPFFFNLFKISLFLLQSFQNLSFSSSIQNPIRTQLSAKTLEGDLAAGLSFQLLGSLTLFLAAGSLVRSSSLEGALR